MLDQPGPYWFEYRQVRSVLMPSAKTLEVLQSERMRRTKYTWMLWEMGLNCGKEMVWYFGLMTMSNGLISCPALPTVISDEDQELETVFKEVYRSLGNSVMWKLQMKRKHYKFLHHVQEHNYWFDLHLLLRGKWLWDAQESPLREEFL